MQIINLNNLFSFRGVLSIPSPILNSVWLFGHLRIAQKKLNELSADYLLLLRKRINEFRRKKRKRISINVPVSPLPFSHFFFAERVHYKLLRHTVLSIRCPRHRHHFVISTRTSGRQIHVRKLSKSYVALNLSLLASLQTSRWDTWPSLSLSRSIICIYRRNYNISTTSEPSFSLTFVCFYYYYFLFFSVSCIKRFDDIFLPHKNLQHAHLHVWCASFAIFVPYCFIFMGHIETNRCT